MKKIYLKLDYNFIQNIRFIQAIMESNYMVVITSEDEFKFKELKRIFHINYQVADKGDFLFENYKILHEQPLTKIGKINKALIFPHGIVKKCKEIWKEERSVFCSFSGFITDQRAKRLNIYIKANCKNQNAQLVKQDTKKNKIINRINNFFKLTPEITQTKIGDILFWSSTRGRVFPIKAWDKDYFELLSDSKFVLCPNGDFLWTYRFFESILCGAIPIIEDYCELYAGFRYKTMKDNLSEILWSAEDAKFNYELCIERLTIPVDELNTEISLAINKVTMNA